jgi:hypothetical protein
MTVLPTTEPSPNAESPTPARRCLHLRTKMDYVTLDSGRASGLPAEPDEDETLGGTAHNHYCLHTFTVIGPDDDLVGPRLCVPGRACYESSGF